VPETKCEPGEAVEADGTCAPLDGRTHTVTPDGDLVVVKCAYGYIQNRGAEALCVPFGC